jgi:hypothetical protein
MSRPIQCIAHHNSDRFHVGCMQWKHGKNRNRTTNLCSNGGDRSVCRSEIRMPFHITFGMELPCAYRIGKPSWAKTGCKLDAIAGSGSCRPAKSHRRCEGSGFRYLATKCDPQRYVMTAKGELIPRFNAQGTNNSYKWNLVTFWSRM